LVTANSRSTAERGRLVHIAKLDGADRMNIKERYGGLNIENCRRYSRVTQRRIRHEIAVASIARLPLA